MSILSHVNWRMFASTPGHVVMKIIIRATCGQDVADAWAADLSVAATPHLPDFDASSPAFDRLLVVSRTISRCWFNPWMEFTRAEVAQSRFLQLECRRSVKEGAGDYNLNIARLRSLPFIATGVGARIRLMDRLALRAVSLKPNQVACAGEWMAEFLVSREVARILENAGLTGFSLRPVFDSKTKRDHETLFQLYTDQLMPRALVDATTPIHPDHADPDDRRQLACLSYDFQGAPPSADFHRTAEAWSNNDMPIWIVTARVRECFERHKLRGWAFRPVLEAGSELHTTYTRMWEDLLARVAASHPGHFF
jgi:hypothetical protein